VKGRDFASTERDATFQQHHERFGVTRTHIADASRRGARDIVHLPILGTIIRAKEPEPRPR
jgi:hypothetical protein